MTRTLICGSLAYDTIMVFQGRFADHILPDQIHILNVSFSVPQLRRDFGGCAGNIAYSLALLGGDPVIMATVGEDAAPYFTRMMDVGLTPEAVMQVPDTLTAQAFITTDLDDNQITAFHPGAMLHSHLTSPSNVPDLGLAIVAPDGRDGMLQHCADLAARGVPFVFDPGQGIPLFSGDELLTMIGQATYVTTNDYECRLIEDKTGRSVTDLAAGLEAFIVTVGAAGSRIHTAHGVLEIPPAACDAVVDPTGCGDAYRAGLLYGIAQGYDWQTTGQLASLMGAIKIASRGGQNHTVTRNDIARRYRTSFGADLPWESDLG